MEADLLNHLGQLIAGGGSVAQLATFGWLWVIHRDVRRDREEVERRITGLEREIARRQGIEF